MPSNMKPKSVLVIGSTGRTGINLIQQLHKLEPPTRPTISAFCRNPSRLNPETKALCDNVVVGDGRNADDLQSAIESTQADCVFVTIGNGASLSKDNTIRTENAKALVQVLCTPEFSHVHVMVVSSNGSGGSQIVVGFGIGTMITFGLRHALKDHDGQEEVILSALKDRTLIVRPTFLTDNQPTGNLATFGDHESPKSPKIDRSDLAHWIVKDGIYGENAIGFGSTPINISGAKF